MKSPTYSDSEKKFLDLVLRNKDISTILNVCQSWSLPNWYLGSGSLVETIWNYFHGFNPNYGIKDHDLIYFDKNDLSYEAEDIIIKQGEKLFKNISIPVEIRNQARVHLWYEKHFGRKIPALTSSEKSINGWPTTATALGLNMKDNQISIYAPFGLDDVFNLIVRPNKKDITEEIYNNKVNRWKPLWPKLKVIPW